jgi:hypothetical protein
MEVKILTGFKNLSGLARLCVVWAVTSGVVGKQIVLKSS